MLQQLPRLAREQPCLPSSWPRSHDEATAEPLACPRGKHLPVSAQTCVTSARYSRHGRVPFFLFALLALELPAADAEIDQHKHGVFICIVAHTRQLTGSMRDTIQAHNKQSTADCSHALTDCIPYHGSALMGLDCTSARRYS